jgi:hypothetical protein
MADDGTVSKSELARLLHVTPDRVFGMLNIGLPVSADRRINRQEALDWIVENVRSGRGGWETDENGRRRRIPID